MLSDSSGTQNRGGIWCWRREEGTEKVVKSDIYHDAYGFVFFFFLQRSQLSAPDAADLSPEMYCGSYKMPLLWLTLKFSLDP